MIELADMRGASGPMHCRRCGADFATNRVITDRRGDPACPRCGSADIRYRPTRTERLRSFLIGYNTY